MSPQLGICFREFDDKLKTVPLKINMKNTRTNIIWSKLAKISAGFLAMASLISLAGTSRADTVTLTDNGNGTVTMANGLVSVIIGKGGGDVSSFTTTANPGLNLIYPKQDYALSLTHIGSGTNDYWANVGSGYGATYSVVTNNGQIVDIMIRNTRATGDTNLFPNGLWDWAEHHVMRAGEAGFYTYHVWRHNASQPAAYYQADSWQGRASYIFTQSTNADGSVSNAWAFSGSDVPPCLSIGAGIPNPGTDGDPGEDSELAKTNYWTRPTGTNYEPGWPAYTQPTGLTSDLYPIWSKYDYSSYQGASNSFRSAWGLATDQVGLWSILGSFEFINGGPTKQKGAISGNYMYNDDFEGHGFGDIPDPSVAAGQVYTKVVGPYFMYANTGTNHMQMWQDAQKMGAQMVSNWPYAWVNESEQDYPRHRGTVTGTITSQTGEPTANAVVILGNCATTDWMFQGTTNFLFWTTADSHGNFTIPKVRPDNYVLFSYVPGIWGELQISNVVVTADQTNNLGVINWNPPHLQQRLWRIGTPDHSSAEFHLGNYPKQFGLWWRYLNDMGTNDLNFTIGKSVESKDWYYAQCSMGITPQSGANNLTDHTQTNGIYWSPHWNVIFNLTNQPTTNVLFTLALAGGRGTAFYTYINGVNATPAPYQTTGYYTTDGVDIYRDVVTIGRYQYYQISFAPSLFVVGTNTLSIRIRQGGAPGSWANSTTNAYPDLVQGGIIYDFLQMETGVPVPDAPTGLTATAGNAQVALTWTASSGATSYNVKRSTTSGSGYVTIASPTTANYTDTTAVNDTTYYYVVSEVNGAESANSSQISAKPEPPIPAVPTGLAATAGNNQVTLNWNASSGATSYNVKRSTTSGSGYATIASPSTASYTDTTAVNGTTYYYVVSAVNGGGESGNSSQVSATPSVLPSPWATADIGAVGVAGGATWTNGLFTVKGSGANIWYAGDEFRYVYQAASGDCSIQAEVLSVQNTASKAKAGVMIRETLNTNSAMVTVALTPSAGMEFLWRTNTAANALSADVTGVTAPAWVKVARTGNSFVGYYSTNGTVWTAMATNNVSITMATNVYIGMAVCSLTNSTTCTATFTNVIATP
jgi:fibronectin type 3 domain-containing protein